MLTALFPNLDTLFLFGGVAIVFIGFAIMGTGKIVCIVRRIKELASFKNEPIVIVGNSNFEDKDGRDKF